MKNALLASLAVMLLAAACGDDTGNSGGSNAGGNGDGGFGPPPNGRFGGEGEGGFGPPPNGGFGGEAPVDPCANALFCEKFDDYAGFTDIADDQEFGPWRAALNPNGAQMNLDSTHTVSGSRALHIHIDGQVEAGAPLQLYGHA